MSFENLLAACSRAESTPENVKLQPFFLNFERLYLQKEKPKNEEFLGMSHRDLLRAHKL